MKKRVDIVLDKDLIELIDKCANYLHVSRSAFISCCCSIFINDEFIIDKITDTDVI